MQKGFWFVFTAIVLAMFGLFALTSDDSSNTSLDLYDPTKLQLTDHIDGVTVKTQAELNRATKNKVVLIEYGDFQCPACQLLEPLLRQLKEDFKGQLVFVFRHFPLSGHAQAMAAHRASEAAHLQDRFWEMHSLIYARQSQWSNVSTAATIFESYAKELKLDLVQFKQDVASAETFARIQVDPKSSQSFSISETPTLILNGTKIGEFATYNELKSLVKTEIN